VRQVQVRPTIAASLVVYALAPLGAGMLIYLLFRPTSLWLFVGVQTLGLLNPLTHLRVVVDPARVVLPSWLIYSFPTGCWSYALCMTVALIWQRTERRDVRAWVMASVITVISCAEPLQRGDNCRYRRAREESDGAHGATEEAIQERLTRRIWRIGDDRKPATRHGALDGCHLQRVTHGRALRGRRMLETGLRFGGMRQRRVPK
jgi:hypothetical protein